MEHFSLRNSGSGLAESGELGNGGMTAGNIEGARASPPSRPAPGAGVRCRAQARVCA